MLEANPGVVWTVPDRNSKVQKVQDNELAQLSSRELRDLQERIEAAIRAAIRAKNMAKLPVSQRPLEGPKPIDLERERDVWLMAKR